MYSGTNLFLFYPHFYEYSNGVFHFSSGTRAVRGSDYSSAIVLSEEKEKFVLKIGEKEKWTNKGTNKQQQPNSCIHDRSTNCQHVHQVSTF